MESKEVLKNSKLFRALKEDELDVLLGVVEQLKFNKDDLVFEEDDDAHSFFIICSGSIEILKMASGGENQRIAILNKSDFFGEMAYFDKNTRTASAKALEPSLAIKVPYDKLTKLFDDHPQVGLKFYMEVVETLCHRMKTTTSQLSSLKELNQLFLV